jgi:vesicle-fusing ATPase
VAGISDNLDELQVTRTDFFNALDEVKPAFGVSEEELDQVIQNGIIHFHDKIEVERVSLLFESRLIEYQ